MLISTRISSKFHDEYQTSIDDASISYSNLLTSFFIMYSTINNGNYITIMMLPVY